MNELAIKNKIYTIRGKQVMLDSDLAELYNIETSALNRAVKRNLERFPEDFMFQLTKEEFQSLRCQIGTSIVYDLKPQNNENNLKCQIGISKDLKFQIGTSSWGGKRKLPYVFTEQGVAMLSGILRSQTAIKVNIQIMRSFIEMRNFLQTNSEIFQRLDKTEQKLLTHDNKIDEIFNLIQEKNIKPDKGIFYDGQIFEAHKFITDLISEAKESIILIDNFVDENTLTLFSETIIPVIIYTKLTPKLNLAISKYNQQYSNIEIKEFDKSHDRFLIIDKTIYHIGASLKDVGKKWFAFSKFKEESFIFLDKLRK